MLQLDTALRRLTFDGRSAELTGRWDTAFVHALIAGRHFSRARAATATQLRPTMGAFGLQGELTATQWSRIVDRVRAALLKVEPEGHWSRRFCYPARGKTTGPWWWDTTGGSEPSLRDAPQPVPAPGTPMAASVPDMLSLVTDPFGDAPVRVLAAFKLALEAIWKADPQHALVLLAEGPQWAGESTAFAVLRRLRRAEVLTAVGAHGRATRQLLALQADLTDPLLAQVFSAHLRLAQMRGLYARDPHASWHGLRHELSALLPQQPELPDRAPDSMAWAEKLHLLALCERRAAEAQLADAGGAPLRTAHAALLLFLLARCYDRAQHVCANLAYTHQKLALQLGAPHWMLAVRWHELSFGLHASFGGAESSAWEYIFLGEFWLDSPEARAACRVPGRGATWDDLTPERMAFYDHGVAVARQLCDPRQIAYTLLNRYRFALHCGERCTRDDALQHLQAHLAAHPDVQGLMLREGYTLPT